MRVLPKYNGSIREWAKEFTDQEIYFIDYLPFNIMNCLRPNGRRAKLFTPPQVNRMNDIVNSMTEEEVNLFYLYTNFHHAHSRI